MGKLTWTVDAAFQRMVRQAVNAGVGVVLVRSGSVYLAANKKGARGLYADGWDPSEPINPDYQDKRNLKVMRARLDKLIGEGRFKTALPIKLLHETVVNGGCREFHVDVEGDEIRLSATPGAASSANKPMKDYADRVADMDNKSLRVLAIVAMEYWETEDDDMPEDGWDRGTTRASMKIVDWLNSDYFEGDEIVQLFKMYDRLLARPRALANLLDRWEISEKNGPVVPDDIKDRIKQQADKEKAKRAKPEPKADPSRTMLFMVDSKHRKGYKENKAVPHHVMDGHGKHVVTFKDADAANNFKDNFAESEGWNVGDEINFKRGMDNHVKALKKARAKQKG